MYPLSIPMTIVTDNVQNLTDLSRPDTRASIKPVRDIKGTVAGFQETIEAEDNEDLATALGSGYSLHGIETENDLALDKSVLRLAPKTRLPSGIDWNEDVDVIHGGKAHVSPARTDTAVITEFVQNPLLDLLACINTHAVSGVDSKKDPYEWRLQARNLWFQHLKTEIALITEHRIGVLFTADTNWAKMPKMHPNQVWLANVGIDKIFFVPGKGANWDLKRVGTSQTIKTPSDHDIRFARVQVVANSLYKVPAPPATLGPIEARIHEWAAQYSGPVMPRDEVADLFRIVKGK